MASNPYDLHDPASGPQLPSEAKVAVGKYSSDTTTQMTDGAYGPLRLDALGNLKVVTSGSSGGGSTTITGGVNTFTSGLQGVSGTLTTQASGSLAPSTFMSSSVSALWTSSNVNGAFNGAAFDTNGAAVVTFAWAANAGLAANTLTGSVALQHSNDAAVWYDLPNVLNFMQARWPIAISAVNLAQSGTLQAPAPLRYVRPQVAFTAGANVSFTGSICTRG